MDGASLLLVVAAFGVSFGWQPAADDPRAYEVTAQIEPELLEVLKSGHSVPIEAHVPAEITPIRKVRIVVGNRKLPRETLSMVAMPAERIVRGQEPTPQVHTARYEESDPWTNDRYPSGATASPPPNRQFDQRGATIGVDNIRTADATSPWGRTQTAVNETGNALRSGVEAGIQQANDQFTRAGDQLSPSASGFGNAVNQQYQNVTGSTAPSQAKSWPAPPPLSTSSSASTTPPALSAAPSPSPPVNRAQPATSWSSINPALAPPRFINPQIATPARGNVPLIADSRGPLHSVLAAPVSTSSNQLPPPPSGNSPPNWASDWSSASGSSAATVTGPSLTAPTVARDPAEDARWAWPTPSPTTPIASATAPPAVDNRYPQSATTATAPATDLWADFPPVQPSNPSAANADNRIAQQSTVTQPAAQSPVQPTIGTAPPTASTQTVAVPGDQLPWLPLLVVSVSLAGSLGANLFLGWSYADARLRYRNLVRKTTNSFHRATSAAA